VTAQHPNPHQAAHPDARINHVLEALRTTEPPTGLEERVAQRLAQAAEARALNSNNCVVAAPTSHASSFFAVILNAVKDPRILLGPARLYTTAATLALLLTLTTITLLHHHTPSTTAQSKPIPSAPTQPTNLAQASALANPQVPQGNTQVPRGFSLGSHSPFKTAGVLTPAPTPDTIALAETRAPSRPAPPMPLTAQEHLLLAATRPGQPIEVAELDIARAPNLRAAANAREDASIRRYVRTLLAPLAVTDALSLTTISQPQEISTPAPAPQPPSSLTN
jgi:hypothetical protein